MHLSFYELSPLTIPLQKSLLGQRHDQIHVDLGTKTGNLPYFIIYLF
jgi:hypothetical protein